MSFVNSEGKPGLEVGHSKSLADTVAQWAPPCASWGYPDVSPTGRLRWAEETERSAEEEELNDKTTVSSAPRRRGGPRGGRKKRSSEEFVALKKQLAVLMQENRELRSQQPTMY